MRRSGNKKEKISTSGRLVAICLSMAMVLGSMSVFAFADETEEDQTSDDPVIEEQVPDEPAEITEAEPADEQDEPELPADTEEAGEISEGPADEETVAIEETVEEIETVSVPEYGEEASTTWYVGDTLDNSDQHYYRTGNTTFRMIGATLGSATYSNNRWTFSNVGYSGMNPRYGQTVNVSFSGNRNNRPVGFKISGGEGTSSSPYTLAAVYHEHSFSITVNESGDVATITCTGKGTCTLQYSEYTASISASGWVYDQEPSEATIARTHANAWPAAVTVSDVSFVGTGETSYEKSSELPEDAGTYKAVADVTDGNTTVTIYMEFEIAKALPEVVAFPEVKRDNYNNEIFLPQGESVDLLDSAGSVEGGTFLYSLDGENYSETLPTASEPGTYAIYLAVKGDKNHQDYDYGPSSDHYVVNYTFASGADSVWSTDSSDPLTFTIKRSRLDEDTFDNAESVYVDDQEVPDSAYDIAAGSAIVTLSADYLKTLAAGKHTITVNFSDPYKVSAAFTVQAPSAAPQTGEYAGAFVLVISAMLAAAGAAFVFKAVKN